QVSDLLLRTSSGELVELAQSGAGRFVGRYVPPAVNYPHVATITVVDRREPTRVVGSASIRLLGKVDYPVTATPGARVSLRVGTREFGPMVADAAGRASVPVVVPPGVATATQITVQDGRPTEGI